MNETRIEVGPEDAGKTLAAVVREACEGLPWSKARSLCRRGKVRVDGEVQTDPAARLARGARVEVDPHAQRPEAGGRLEADAVLHLDRDVVVVNKPAGLLTVPYRSPTDPMATAEDRDTLLQRLAATVRRIEGHSGPPPRTVQRLDRDTSGILVFARTRKAERFLQQQFRVHDVDRVYEALAYGKLRATTHETFLVPDRGDGLRGSLPPRAGYPPPGGKRAKTHVHPLEVFEVGSDAFEGASGKAWTISRVECRLETGRQHQIRIHLAESGHPLVGERVYIREHLGAWLPGHEPGKSRPMLHAKRLGFVHPRTEETMSFECPPPSDFAELLAKLRTRDG